MNTSVLAQEVEAIREGKVTRRLAHGANLRLNARMVAVTGATGHLGTVLVQQLLERGEEVRYTTRSGVPHWLKDTAAIPVEAGLFDEDALVRAFEGASVVYHCAARISLLPGDNAELHRVNVDGTAVVLQAARRAGVDRFVHVGTVEAFPLENGPSPITEAAGIDPDRTIMEYGRSKALGIQLVLDACGDGTECVVVCPTGILGPPDHRGSHLGRVVADLDRGRMPATVTGGFDFVDVRDVATGLILAAERGQPGAVYLLSGEYVTVPDLTRIAARVAGVRPPALCLPNSLIRPFMPLVETWYRITHAQPRFTRDTLYLLSREIRIDSSRARTELGYSPRPLEETLADSVHWFRENQPGY